MSCHLHLAEAAEEGGVRRRPVYLPVGSKKRRGATPAPSSRRRLDGFARQRCAQARARRVRNGLIAAGCFVLVACAGLVL
jgi:hypothetical protein